MHETDVSHSDRAPTVERGCGSAGSLMSTVSRHVLGSSSWLSHPSTLAARPTKRLLLLPRLFDPPGAHPVCLHPRGWFTCKTWLQGEDGGILGHARLHPAQCLSPLKETRRTAKMWMLLIAAYLVPDTVDEVGLPHQMHCWL